MNISKTLLLVLFLGASCNPKMNLTQSQFFTQKANDLNMALPGQVKENLEFDQFGKFTTKTYQTHIDQVAPNQRDKIIFYSNIVDIPAKTPYTALGKIVTQLDTSKLKTQGFINRTVNNQPYLHKRNVDRKRKLVSSEFIVKADSGYFYLFSYAPIGHLLPNEEDVIIAQDSLNRKHVAIIGSLKRK